LNFYSLAKYVPIYAIFIYFIKISLDVFILNQSISRHKVASTVKSIGTDLYWMGVMIWGPILISKRLSCPFVKYLTEYPHLKIFVLLALFVGAIIITILKRAEENLSSRNVTGVQRFGRSFFSCVLVGLMLLLGASNFLVVFYNI